MSLNLINQAAIREVDLDDLNVVPGAKITIRDSTNNNIAAIYNSDNLLDPKPNPFFADNVGQIEFFIDSGLYTVYALTVTDLDELEGIVNFQVKSDTNLNYATYDFASSALTFDLSDIDAVSTKSGLLSGDSLGSEFISSGVTDNSKSSTVNVGDGSFYDVNGKQFIHRSKNVNLESLEVPYSEASSITLQNIIDLRTKGFNVKLNPLYKLTTFDGQNTVRNNQKEMIAHRGWRDQAPQNTLLAFSMAYNRTTGQNIAFECDVQITSDGIPVVFHDNILELLTTGTGAVKDHTLAEIKALTFLELAGTAFENDVHIPTLDEFIQYSSYVGVKIYPEIKEYRTIADIEIMNDIVTKYDYSNYTVFQSFRIEDLQELRKFNQQSGVGFLSQTGYTQQLLDDLVVIGNVSMLIQRDDLVNNPEDVTVFHSYGFDVVAWTATRIEHIQDLAAIGVQKVITDKNLFQSANTSMMATQHRFNQKPWSELTTGGGVVTYSPNPENAQSSGDIVFCGSAVGSSAFVAYPLSVSAGENIQVTVLAKNHGGYTDNALVNIENKNGQRIDTINVIGEEMIEYQMQLQAPVNETFALDWFSVHLGSLDTRDAGGRFYRPTFKTSQSKIGHPKTLMSGMLNISGAGTGLHILDPDTISINVDTIMYAVNDDIEIRPHTEGNLSQTSLGLSNYYAIGFITPTEDGQAIEPVSFYARVKGSTGSMRISGRNPATNAAVNLNNLSQEHRVYFKVEI